MIGAIFALPTASTQAERVDSIVFALSALSLFIVGIVALGLAVFSVRYRRGSKAKRGPLPEIVSREFEIGWTSATIFLFVFIFWWASSADLSGLTPPPNALEIHVLAKQWMWKTQHPSGAREIDALHAPVDRPVRLVMTSQDTIHSFYVPAFRLKQDVLPDVTEQAWFQATKVGVFPLLCAEYCGTDHSAMRGRITIMRPEDYAAWTVAQPQGDDLATRGARLFTAVGCSGCHAASSKVHAPSLTGIYGRMVHLADGGDVRVDDAYIRDSIVQPRRQIVAGYEPIMPSFAGQLDDGQIQSLTAYIRSLATPPGDAR